MRRLGAILFLSVALSFSGIVPNAFAEGVTAGVSDTTQDREAQPGNIRFDPPCNFSQTLPLELYMSTATEAYFYSGNGAVLDECGNFGVSGHSAPNFLAWNSDAVNIDGTIPALPALIYLLQPAATFSMNIGSLHYAGEYGGIAALDDSFNVVDTAYVTLSDVLQNVAVSYRAIRWIYIFGPSIMVADNLEFN